MAGSLYLGSQRVCPAIVIGQQEPQEYDSLIRMPKGLKELQKEIIRVLGGTSQTVTESEYIKILLDLNEVESIVDAPSASYSAFISFFPRTSYWLSIDIKADNLKEAGDYSFYQFAGSSWLISRETNIFYNPVITFPKLEKIGNYCFYYFVNPGVTDVYLPKLKTSSQYGLTNICKEAKSQVTLHFASNQEPLISSLHGYPNFGSKYSVTILYDQPPTE